MHYTTIIDANEAGDHLSNSNWVFIDCRFVLRNPEQGYQDYLKSHIPGAIYAHLDRDLSGPIIKGKTGRHPLPDQDKLVATFSSWGIDSKTQVVAYDESSGAMAAARLWWLFKWAGHDAVAVLDGGLKRWKQSGHPVAAGLEKREPEDFIADFHPEMIFQAEDVLRVLNDPSYTVVDSRSADRYRGENETIDPVAGHIQGATSCPFTASQDENGLMKPPNELRAKFEKATSGAEPDHTVFYCGSGVTAAYSVLAYVHSGNPMPRLYAGSWSDWITDPSRPTAVGESPK